MAAAKKRGNPNLKPVWTTLDTKVIRIPVYLADTMMSLARQVDGGKIKQSKLNQLCLNPEAIAQELTAITGKPALAIVPDPEPKPIELLIEQFEAEQAASWGTNPNQRGEFKTTSRSWDKYHEFKEWLAKR
ncbi:MAG: hypothetical protein DCE90_17995 [Pseudanabaena sp.]|nr:MAG: hypothetical protein DCE90_17995 [Pseudanabaena sp.]